MIVQLFENPAVRSRDWVAELEDQRVWIRRNAAGGLAGSAEEARGAAAALARSLADPDTAVRKLAAQGLALAGAAALEPLIEALQQPSPCARTYAAALLGRLGAAGAGALPALLEALRDPEPAVRWSAAQALEALAPAPQVRGKAASGNRSRRRP